MVNGNSCIIPRPPLYFITDRETFNRSDGPLMEWENGHAIYRYRNIIFNRYDFERLILNRPDMRTVLNVDNTEIRTVVLERHGRSNIMTTTSRTITNILRRAEWHTIDTWITKSIITGSPCTCSLIQLFDSRRTMRVPMRILSLEDHSTHKETIIQVPQGTRNAKEGVAWSFGMTESEYDCLVES